MARRFHRKQLVTRYVVTKHYYKGPDLMTEEFPILYGTMAEAEDMRAKLEAGSDKSFFDGDSDESPILFTDVIDVEI